MSNEEWKDIKGYEGLYKISNLGRIKSMERYISTKRGERLQKERIMTNLKSGNYLVIDLRDDFNTKRFIVHRLVAKYFIKSFDEEAVIGFTDGNTLNCNLDNLHISYKTNPLKAPLRSIEYDLSKWDLEVKNNRIFLKEKE